MLGHHLNEESFDFRVSLSLFRIITGFLERIPCPPSFLIKSNNDNTCHLQGNSLEPSKQPQVWSLDQQWRTSGVVHALEAAEVVEADTEEVRWVWGAW